MHFSRTLSALVGAALLVGCQAPLATTPSFVISAPAQAVARVVVALDGSFQLQSLVAPNDVSRIDHVRLTLLACSAEKPTQELTAADFKATGVSIEVPASDLGKPVTLGSLKLDSHYRLEAEAFTEGGASLSSQHRETNAVIFSTPSIVTSPDGTQTVDNAELPIVTIPLALDALAYPGYMEGVLKAPSLFLLPDPKEVEIIVHRVGTPASKDLHQRFTMPNDRQISFTVQHLKLDSKYRVIGLGRSSSGLLVSYDFIDVDTPKAAAGQVVEDTVAANLKLKSFLRLPFELIELGVKLNEEGAGGLPRGETRAAGNPEPQADAPQSDESVLIQTHAELTDEAAASQPQDGGAQ